MDYLPRTDLWSDEPFGQILHGDNERFAVPGSRFSHSSAKICPCGSTNPTSNCYMVPPTDETTAIIRATAHEMIDRWLGWFDDANRP